MEYKHKKFCDIFLIHFDINLACTGAKVNKNKMVAIMYDRDSEVNKYIQSQIDLYALSNSFITTDFVKYKLGMVVAHGSSANKVAASKILLGYEDTEDKTKEFTDLIKAIKQ